MGIKIINHKRSIKELSLKDELQQEESRISELMKASEISEWPDIRMSGFKDWVNNNNNIPNASKKTIHAITGCIYILDSKIEVEDRYKGTNHKFFPHLS